MDSYQGKELKEALDDEGKKQLFANIGGKLGTEVGTMLDELVDGLEEVENSESGESSYQDFFKYYMKKKQQTDDTNDAKVDEVVELLNKVEKSTDSSDKEDTGDFNLNDYILKTQIVPPVCPTCLLVAVVQEHVPTVEEMVDPEL